MLATLCVMASAPAHAQSENLAAAVKATFLVKFGAYVAWPPAALPDGAPLAICTVGSDPLDSMLDAAAKGQTIGGHAIQVRHLTTIDAASGCQIAYFRHGRAPAALAGTPVLTVTDGEWRPHRGMVDFEISGGRVRFNIDQAAANAAGLTISSKLLDVALSVRPAAG